MVTGEFVPKLQNSSLARVLILELDCNSVNLAKLSELQKNPGVLINFQIILIQHVLSHPDRTDKLFENFKHIRNELLENGNLWHPRCAATIAWLTAATLFISEILPLPLSTSEILNEVTNLCQSAYNNYGEPDEVSIYLTLLMEMIETGELPLSHQLEQAYTIAKADNCITFANKPVFNRIKKKADENGYKLNISLRKLLKELEQKQLLVPFCNGEHHTISRRYSDGGQRRVIRLNYTAIKKYTKED